MVGCPGDGDEPRVSGLDGDWVLEALRSCGEAAVDSGAAYLQLDTEVAEGVGVRGLGCPPPGNR